MTVLAPKAVDAGFDRLNDRLVLAYRAIWVLLALATAATIATAVHEASVHPAVLTLRLIKAVILVVVCAILLRRRANDPVAALLSLAFLMWAFSSSFDFSVADLGPRLADRMRFLLFVLALLLFPDGAWQPRWARPLAAASGAVFVVGVGEAAGLLPTRIFLPLAIGCVVGAIAALIVRFRTVQTHAVRQQLKWIALGLVVGIGTILTARAGAALDRPSADFAPMPILWEGLFQLGIVITALGFLVALLRYRLFDAETAISRSAVLAGLTIAAVAIFAGAEAAIESVGQRYLGMGIGDVSAAMAAAIAAVIMNPLHGRISDWAERRFQHDLVCLKSEFPPILADLAASADPRELGQAILPRIDQAVHAVRSALIVRGRVVAASGIDPASVQAWTRRVLTEHSGVRRIASEDVLFPLRLQLKCSAADGANWLLLGPRPDQSFYGQDDLNALNVVKPKIRDALSWALARERTRNEHRRQLRRIRAEIESLNNRLNSLKPGPGGA